MVMVSSRSVAALGAFVLLSILVVQVNANNFKGTFLRRDTGVALTSAFEMTLLNEIEEALGNDHRRGTEGRLSRIEDALRATFAALPKNEHGKLNSASARYALHRLFVERHGWFVRGIEAGGETWNSSSPAMVLEGRVPEHVQDLFEQRLGGHGFGLHDLAVLAATLEHLVHNESIERLRDTYSALQMPLDSAVSQEAVTEVIDAYMAVYIIGLNITAMNPQTIRREVAEANEVYPTWSDTQTFLREVKRRVAPETGPLKFERVAAVIEEVGERYGRWQAAECRTLKGQLVEMEDQGTGRVRLSQFYNSALNEGNWQFSESIDHLRELGALDETQPNNLRLIIPNYINSPSNCIAPSQYHAVCCLDECEELIGHLEKTLAAPSATPAVLVPMISELPSATVPANRTLSAPLLQRLDDVANHHRGRVPLHGRLFAQWMHYAYPRECPYPHVSGTTSPKRLEEIEASGMSVSATREDMIAHIEASARSTTNSTDQIDHFVSWTMEEELVTEHLFTPTPVGRQTLSVFRGIALISAVGAALASLSKSVTNARKFGNIEGDKKDCFV
jgi:hypothetical protein